MIVEKSPVSIGGSTMCVCPKCGKKFIKPVENVYNLTVKGRLKHYCSYSCWRKAGGGK